MSRDKARKAVWDMIRYKRNKSRASRTNLVLIEQQSRELLLQCINSLDQAIEQNSILLFSDSINKMTGHFKGLDPNVDMHLIWAKDYGDDIGSVDLKSMALEGITVKWSEAFIKETGIEPSFTLDVGNLLLEGLF